MSQWVDRILEKFPADVARFWIATDPDELLLDERVLSNLRARSFEVLPFEDSVVFRADYEERYRAAWDRDVDGPAWSLILQVRSSDADQLPWDYIRQGRPIRLSIAELFPRL